VRSPVRHRAVLVFAIAILPWAAVSALGERGRRVAVVRARQQVLSSPEGSEEPATGRAVELLDELLGRLPA
jgi:hypothetical protein